MARLRVGVIGCGTIAQVMWLPNLRELDDQFELKAICDISPGVTESLGEYYSVSRRFNDYHDLVQDDLDAVIVLTPGSHAAPAIAALEAGKHVIVEKPMCFTLREADAMIAASKRASRRLMVAYMKRYDPGYRYGRELVRSMAGLRYVQINVLHPSEPQYVSHHRIKRFNDVPQATLEALQHEADQLAAEAIGPVSDRLRFLYLDVFLGSMIHDVNALRGVLGSPDQSMLTTLWPDNVTYPTITTVLSYRDGPRAVFTWSYLSELRDYFEELAFFGEESRVRIQFPSPYLRHFPTPVEVQGMENGAEWRKRVNVSYAEAFKEELLHFYECVNADREPLTNGSDGKDDIAFLQKIVAAASPEGLGGEAKR
ncbi:MAG TPA: Gfo/Idh/MocA family oxidoreductase [Terriglobia bacterium]|nr:Gfo/Idh/MocA family oxidoreductase [Terriglobia bacterium]